MAVSPLLILTFYFSSIVVSARTFHGKLNIGSDSEHLYLAQDSKNDPLTFSLVNIMIALDYCTIICIKLRKLPSILGLLTGQGLFSPCKYGGGPILILR